LRCAAIWRQERACSRYISISISISASIYLSIYMNVPGTALAAPARGAPASVGRSAPARAIYLYLSNIYKSIDLYTYIYIYERAWYSACNPCLRCAGICRQERACLHYIYKSRSISIYLSIYLSIYIFMNAPGTAPVAPIYMYMYVYTHTHTHTHTHI